MTTQERELREAKLAIVNSQKPRLATLEDPPDWRTSLITDRSGKPKPLLANAIAALRQSPEWTGVLTFNEFSLATVTAKPAPLSGTSQPGPEWTDHEDRLTANWLQHCGILVSAETAGQAVQVVARDNPFHPVRNYLERLKWDRTKRIDDWLVLYLGADPSDYVRAVGAKWLIGGVARIFRPGVKNDTCPILEGPQGSLKSTALRTLAGDDFFSDDIAELGSKDSVLQTRGAWIIELAELDSMTRGDVSRVKAFMSRQVDRIRPPYGRHVIAAARECIFVGTTNKETYLKDESGNRRFHPLKTGTIDISTLRRDRDQLWAEARERFRANDTWWLDTKALGETAAEEAEARYEGDPWDDKIRQWIDGQASVSVSDVLSLCMRKAQDQWTQTDQNRVARCLRAANWERFREREGTFLEWKYRKKASK